MSPDPVTRVVVAHAGLDVLHTVRLKAACALLMAGRIQVDLVQWPAPSAQLLIVFDDAGGRQASAAAMAKGVKVLCITRTPLDRIGPSLPYNCSVLQVSRKIAELLPSDADGSGIEAPLLRQLLAREPGLFMAQDGASRLVIDAASGCLYLLSDMTDTELAARVFDRAWMLAPVPQQRFDEELASKVFRRLQIEAFLWTVAATTSKPLPVQVPEGELQLRGWPVVAPGVLPVRWLLPIGCLLQRPWSLESLLASGVGDRDALGRIFAIAGASGLVLDGAVAQVRTVRQRDPARDGFLTRVARRFGLDFFGVARAK